jgi:hypothetical protein
MTDDNKPNPGSDEARSRGCTCPVMDNSRGIRKPWTGSWWINDRCPLHGDGRELAPV